MKEILIEESNVVQVSAPVTVVGSINGKFYDLCNIFEVIGQVPDKRYLFNGAIVGLHYTSTETVQLLMCLKVKYPHCITLLRGVHETRLWTTHRYFKDEIEKKYGNLNAWKYCTDVFDYFPLAATIEGKIFCVSGGLSHDMGHIDQINMLNRVMEVPNEGPVFGMMWADPADLEYD